MAVTKKTFFVQFSHFFTGQVAILLIGFVSFPILTRLLSIDQYGILSLVANTMALFVAFAKAGLSDGIIRFHDDYLENRRRKSFFISTIFNGGVVLSLSVTSLYLIALPTLFDFFHIDKKYYLCFWLMSFYLFIRPLNIICLNILRVNGKTIHVNITNLIDKIISVTIGLVLLIYVIKDIYGFFLGTVISEYLIFVGLFLLVRANYKINFFSFSFGLSRNLIVFGLPLLFSEISYLVLTYADRYIILFFHGEKELGLYSVGYNLAMYISGIITFSVSYAIVPLFVKIYGQEGREATEKFLQGSFYYLLVGIIPVCFGYYAITDDLFIVLASEKYRLAAQFSPIILYGSIFLGLNSVLNAGLYIHKKTHVIFAIIISGVIVNIMLNFMLIPIFHSTGAAWATLFSCLLTTLLTVLLSFKYITVKVNLRIVYHVLLALVMFFVVNCIETGSNILNLLLKIGLGGVFTIAGVLYMERKLAKMVQSKLKGISDFTG